ncbi:MAG: helix-turn-helix transcriptional regulator [Clostridia bacterium]|nr:helix-turn-helix transcriptional regulator [Clostridia bacterium]MBP3555091.1 helix-turn-helix transcriptional regulator [Clostridia bacterium]
MKKYENRLRDLRQDKDMTQAEVAEKFFMQPTQYRRYENGDSDLPLELAKKFALYYDVSIDYLAKLKDIRK